MLLLTIGARSQQRQNNYFLMIVPFLRNEFLQEALQDHACADLWHGWMQLAGS